MSLINEFTQRAPGPRLMAPHPRGWLGPGVRLMRHATFPMKLGILCAVLLLPACLMTVTLLQESLAAMRHAERARQGIEITNPIVETVAELVQFRGFVHRALSGEDGARRRATEIQKHLAERVRSIDDAVRALGDPQLSELWQAPRATLTQASQGPLPRDRARAYEDNTARLEALRSMLRVTAERSGLVVAPGVADHFLVDILVNLWAPWNDRVGRVMTQGGGFLTRGDANRVEKASLLQMVGTTDRLGAEIATRIAGLHRERAAPAASWASARDHVDRLLQTTRDLFEAEALVGEPEPHLRLGDEATTTVLRFGRDIVAALEGRLASQVASTRARLLKLLGINLVGLLLLAYVVASFHISFSGAMRRALRLMRAMTAGDLSQPVRIEGRDEIAQLGAEMETMSATLSRLVAEIRSSAVRVGKAGQLVADEGRSLSQRTEAQAKNLRQSVSSVEHLGSAVSQTAQATADLDQLAANLAEHAERGGQAMRETIQSIAALQSTTRRVAEINGVIDEIAFQTNLLALNAAVEASHAGEAGKGFAVVAGEVRELAQRCAEAAGEIRELIAQTTQQTDHSAIQVRDVDVALVSVVSGIGEVASRLRGIAQSSAEQSEELGQVSRGVEGLDQITRQNAEMVAVSARSSQALVRQADALTNSVAAIRLRFGSADEAMAIVQHAMELLSQQGWETARKAFNDPDGPFHDRDMALFVADREGRLLAFSARPEWVGRALHDLPGITSVVADRMFDAVTHAAAQGGGWAEYEWLNFDTGQPAHKTAWIAPLEDGALMGCACYRAGAEALLAA